MLNYETLLSNYDDKLTLMQWLKKVEDALKDASAVSFDVVNLGNATFKFKIVFEDGSEIESDPLVVNQGDSVASAAIVNGDLILTLTNGDTIDAGSMFDGNVNITGTLDVGGNTSITGTLSVDDNVTITGNVSQLGDALINGDLDAGVITGSKLQSTGDISASGTITGGEIVENMAGYSFTPSTTSGMTTLYAGIVKTGNKITAVVSLMFTPASDISASTPLGLGKFDIPASIGSKLVPFTSQTLTNVLDIRTGSMNAYVTLTKSTNLVIYKNSNTQMEFRAYPLTTIQGDGATNYYIRYEATFLLSDNLAA